MNYNSRPMPRLKSTFKPIPMKELLANIQALAVDISESSDDDSFASLVKNAKVKPAFGGKGDRSRDRAMFDRVDVMPTIEATNSKNSVLDDIIPHPPLLEKKKTDRCLFPGTAKDKPAEPCSTSTSYVNNDQPKLAKPCPARKNYISRKQELARDKATELCPPRTTFVINSHQRSAKDKAAKLCSPSTNCVAESHRKPVKDMATELRPPSTNHEINSHHKPAKDESMELCPPSTTYVINRHQQTAKDKPAELCPPSTNHVINGHQKPVNNRAPEPCTPSTTHAIEGYLVPATPTQPQTRTSTVQYKSISIKGKKYMYIRLVGFGGSSHVYKVLEIATSNEFAMKSVNLTCDPEISQGYLNEVKVLRDLQASDRVVKLYAYEHVKSANTLNLVLELGETSLATFLHRYSGGAPPALVLHYWEEMLQAVQQIHSHGIVHADLKPGNFLLVSGNLKLIDFGIASKVSSDATSVERSSERGTFSYISPEALRGDGSHPIKVSFYSDVWSLGCILYSLVYGHTPFASYSNVVKIATIQDPNHRIKYPTAEHIPPSLMAVLKQCLRYNGHSRPTVTELLKHNHIIQEHPSIPDDILAKVQPHVTPREFNLLRSAKVTAEALSYAET